MKMPTKIRRHHIALLAVGALAAGGIATQLSGTQQSDSGAVLAEHYTVEAGESYTSIALKLHLDPSVLACANADNIDAPACPSVTLVLSTGRIIHIPPVVQSTTTTLASTTTSAASSTTVAATTTSAGPTTTIANTGTNITFPVTAAFYYPWFPETWSVNGVHVKYHPTNGYYSSDDATVVANHMAGMAYGKINVAISSWWGQGTHNEAVRTKLLLDKAAATGVKIAFYYEKEGATTQPTVAQITADLNYLQTNYGSHPGAATVNGKIVVFVYNADDLTCAITTKWKQANTIGAYIDLKVFSGYAACPDQPSSWHQYSPASATGSQGSFMYAISPGFFRADETTPRLARDITRWQSNVASMKASTAKWHLITTFNEWGEGTAIEGATEWSSASGFGQYLDALHGGVTPPPPTTTTVAATTTTTPNSTTTVVPTTTTSPASTTTVPAAQAVVVGAGDICKIATIGDPTKVGQGIQAEVNKGAKVITMGDNQYEAGAYSDYLACYDKAWGSFKAQTYPAPGNHDYGTAGAAGYFQYFGTARVGTAPLGYYTWQINADWLGISLNDEATGQTMTNQLIWLTNVLDNNPNFNVLAYMHEPVASSGQHGASTRAKQLWDVMYPRGVDIVLAGHDHDYEQFGLLNAASTGVSATGIKFLVVGTGGANHYSFTSVKPGSITRNSTTFGFEKLTLRKSDYDLAFIANAPSTFTDTYHGTIVR